MALQEKHTDLLERCVESLKIYKNIIGELKDENKGAELDYLKELTKEYCTIDFDFQRAQDALKKTEENITESYSSGEIERLYKENLSTINAEQNYADHDIWRNIFLGEKDIEEVHQQEEVINERDFERVDESLMCSNIFSPPIDPISKTIIKNPYKNKKCGHVYEEKYIFAYIKSMKNKAKCPYMGCNNKKFVASHLEEDIKLKSRIEDYNSQKNLENDSDSD